MMRVLHSTIPPRSSPFLQEASSLPSRITVIRDTMNEAPRHNCFQKMTSALFSLISRVYSLFKWLVTCCPAETEKEEFRRVPFVEEIIPEINDAPSKIIAITEQEVPKQIGTMLITDRFPSSIRNQTFTNERELLWLPSNTKGTYGLPALIWNSHTPDGLTKEKKLARLQERVEQAIYCAKENAFKTLVLDLNSPLGLPTLAKVYYDALTRITQNVFYDVFLVVKDQDTAQRINRVFASRNNAQAHFF